MKALAKAKYIAQHVYNKTLQRCRCDWWPLFPFSNLRYHNGTPHIKSDDKAFVCLFIVFMFSSNKLKSIKIKLV